MYRYLCHFLVAFFLSISIALLAEEGELLLNFNLTQTSIPPELQNLPYAIYPNDPEYNTARLNFNKRFVYFPKAIIIPETNEQIQYVVRVFKKYHLDFALRSGGHCFEPGSLSSDYIIDVRNFNSIIPDITNEQVYIGSGCQLGSVIETLGQINYAIPTGTCPTVGIAGLTMGGGIGVLSRNFGLTCDSVISITFLDANAEIIEVNASSHPDLFWALLGAGNGSYGIALGFTFKMYFIPIATYYELTWKWDPELLIPLMSTWQKWVRTLPDNITTVLGINHPIPNELENAPPVLIRITGLKVGSDPFTEWVLPFKKFNPQVKIFQGRYINTAQFWMDKPPFPPFNKSKSRILKKPISKNVMKRVIQFFEKIDKRNPNYQVSFNFEAFGGKIPEFDTVFYPRNAFGWWQQTYYWNFQKQNGNVLAISKAFYKSIPREVSPYCYANFVDYDLGEKYLKLYYGSHVDRLIKIKDIYDPTNLFHWKQGIPTSTKRSHDSISLDCEEANIFLNKN